MSDAGEKPFEATPQHIAKAKREGNVARSSELSANLAFAAAAAAVVAVTPTLGGLARRALVAARIETPWTASAMLVAAALVPIACAVVAAFGAVVMQNGGITPAGLVIRFERLNPVEGCKRILSRDTLAHGLRAVAAVVLVGIAVAQTIAVCAIAMTKATALGEIAADAWQATQRAAFSACGVGILFAVVEHVFARGAWLRKLRMSLDERRREAKEQEGDPLERGRRRTLHRALLRGAISSVKNASFVVTNPTHVAVALEYRPPEVDVPRVVVLAAGEAAQRVRILAAHYRIPIVENAALARALYRDGRVHEAIAATHFVAVAEVVAALLRSGALELP
ncbi:MAG: EscU/YscU/HrcU family type III secretion system export apparatus switch protein [Candidatus Eremiobacteraeota bacterium]|nr:EscU/YscU/HrcU family type III secretion system export apparatus switch protein [Candidatus Eremiobacteraeota bacterium]